MFPPQQDTDGLQELSLSEVLQRDDLCVQEVLSIAGIQSKIKQELRLFLGHCARNESFADRLITLGLKCPMHQSASPQMQTLTFIAADILTSDQDALADFLLPTSASNDEGEIAEEIETEEAWSEGSRSQSQRYKWLNRVMEYLQGGQLDENCINYIVKSIQVLVRKRLGTLLEYLRACPDVLSRLAHLAHFPSIAQLFTKLITDEDDHMPPAAREARQMVIPLLLQKLHNDLALSTALEVVDCLESILQASRYSDPEEACSQLQTLSDIIVSAEETSFHISVLLSTPSPAATNAAAYLGMVVNRMNQDESQDGIQRPFRPTLLYQVEQLFTAFAKLAAMAVGFEGDRLLTVRWMQLLVGMGRHSRFAGFYSSIPRDERLQAIRKLVWGVARGNYFGVKLQLVSSLVELAILQEESISESHPDHACKLSPKNLYSVLSDHQLHLRQLVESLGHEGPRQRNRNEQGIFLRKLLVVLENFFKNSEIHRQFPQVLQSVAALFPTFTPEACRQYMQGAAIRNHPAGLRARPPLEFGFFRRNQAYLDSQLQLQKKQKIEAESLAQQKQEVLQEEKKPKEEIVFKLTQKIRTLKDRVKQKQIAKTNHTQTITNQIEKDSNISHTPKQGSFQLQEKVLSPLKDRSLMPCLLFFVRHLAIY